MDNSEWVRRVLFSEGPGRRSIIVATLIGWLFIFAVVAKMFLGCATSFRQAALPLEEHFYKIEEASSGKIGTEVITLQSPLSGELSFLENDFSSEDSDANVSTGDVTAIAMIGVSRITPGARTVSFSRSVLFHPIIDRAAAQYQVDPALVRAIIFAESGYNPAAVSKRGAMGLMQLMPSTAKAMGVDDCFDPEHNIYGGVKYFKKLFNQFGGDVRLALAAYNAGSRKVREFNGVPPFRATERYIQKVMKYYNIYKAEQPEQVGLS